MSRNNYFKLFIVVLLHISILADAAPKLKGNKAAKSESENEIQVSDEDKPTLSDPNVDDESDAEPSNSRNAFKAFNAFAASKPSIGETQIYPKGFLHM
jgi:hypothetical protein